MRSKPVLTEEVAHAASLDAGNRHMRKHGRKRWNGDDYMMAVAEFDRLWPIERDLEEAKKL